MQDKSKSAANENNGSQLNQDDLNERVERLMGPTADEAPAESETTSSQTNPSTAPEVPGAEESPQPTETSTQVDEKSSSPAETPEAENPDPVTDKAVDEIVAKEGDELLAAEDAKISATTVPPKTGFKDKLKAFFVNWWQNPKARKATIAGLILLVVIILAVPPSRYFLLNTAGIRVKASLTVFDDSTQQPLKNVQVRLSGVTAKTDEEGKVKLEHLKLGSTNLVIEKRGFAPLNRKLTLGWGSNPLPEFALTPTGSQYAFMLTDFLSGKPIQKAEATSGEASALSDEKGKILLTIDEFDDQPELKVRIAAETYRDEELTIDANAKNEHRLKLVPRRKHVFISKRSGKYDVYKVDVDGKNEKLVLTGTGSEREDMVVLPHPTDEVAALVSTRDNLRNSDKFLLSSLLILDLNSDEAPVKVAQSEQIQLVNWLGDRLVYVQIAAGSSAASPKRQRLMSYDYKNDDNKELAASNYFNDVLAAAGQIYYATSIAYQSDQPKLVRINPDGSNAQTVLDKEVWNVFRTEYDRLSLSVQQEWYDYTLGAKQAEKAKGAPAVVRTRLYMDNADKSRSLWVDERDGKGVLLAYNLNDKSDTVLRTQSGLRYPVRWLNNKTVVYRIHTDQETADYVMNIEGGEPLKIRDVTNTASPTQWYY